MATSLYRTGRRSFLRAGAILAGGTLAAPGVFDALVARGALAATTRRGNLQAGYGPLEPIPDLRDGALRLALPRGFTYRSFGVAGTPMADGYLAPLGHDAMAAFPLPNGNIRIVRNHEDKNGAGAGSLEGPVARKYDPAGGGGTVSLEIDPAIRELVHDFISLSGTTGNCAGGRTPWGSWLTCEEALVGPGDGWSHPHGYVFEVPALATGPVAAEPLTAMGRMLHEAAVVDPASGIVYETEDNGPAGFYRYLPTQPGNFAAGGRLQMLAIRSMPNFDTARGQQVGAPLPVEWVDIAKPDPDERLPEPIRLSGHTDEAVANPRAVFDQGFAQGAASFSRLEGAWFDGGRVYFNSTDGGDAGLGQVWQYDVASDQLTLIFESTSRAMLANPDNITMSQRGGIVLCEDTRGEQHLRGLTLEGDIFDLALNLNNDFEWAGACYGPDGQTLFVNRQGPTRGPNPPDPGDEGMTFAIWGPWAAGSL